MTVLFGIRVSSLDEARSLIEKILGIHFEERESIFHGGRYFAFGKPSLRHIILQENVELDDEELAEPDFPDWRYLLYLIGTSEYPQVLAALQSEPELIATLETTTYGER